MLRVAQVCIRRASSALRVQYKFLIMLYNWKFYFVFAMQEDALICKLELHLAIPMQFRRTKQGRELLKIEKDLCYNYFYNIYSIVTLTFFCFKYSAINVLKLFGHRYKHMRNYLKHYIYLRK